MLCLLPVVAWAVVPDRHVRSELFLGDPAAQWVVAPQRAVECEEIFELTAAGAWQCPGAQVVTRVVPAGQIPERTVRRAMRGYAHVSTSAEVLHDANLYRIHAKNVELLMLFGSGPHEGLALMVQVSGPDATRWAGTLAQDLQRMKV